MSSNSMLLLWNIYEIESKEATLHGVMLRGRIRKFTLETNINCLVENASDKENVVRFAVLIESSPDLIFDFIKTILPDADIRKVLESVQNPILSKLKVNDASRYLI
jgi:hypothetical protein